MVMFGRQAFLPVDLEHESTRPDTYASEYYQCEDPDLIRQFTNHLDTFQQAKQNILTAQIKYKVQYDKCNTIRAFKATKLWY